MSFLSVTYILLFYAATIILFVGVGRRIYKYAKTPAPLKIPTMPAPTTKVGVAARLTREVVFFESLFKANLWTWIFGWMFHASLLIAFFRHLRYVVNSDTFLIGPVIHWHLLQLAGQYTSFTLIIGLAGLLARRIFVDRVRYISAPSDYLMLLLIIGIGVTGALMTFVAHTDIVALKDFVIGLFTFSFSALPTSLLLLLHLGLVIVLMIIFPISKLLHAPGLFFSPTRNQVDNSREKRHIADWAKPLDETRGKS